MRRGLHRRDPPRCASSGSARRLAPAAREDGPHPVDRIVGEQQRDSEPRFSTAIFCRRRSAPPPASPARTRSVLAHLLSLPAIAAGPVLPTPGGWLSCPTSRRGHPASSIDESPFSLLIPAELWGRTAPAAGPASSVTTAASRNGTRRRHSASVTSRILSRRRAGATVNVFIPPRMACCGISPGRGGPSGGPDIPAPLPPGAQVTSRRPHARRAPRAIPSGAPSGAPSERPHFHPLIHPRRHIGIGLGQARASSSDPNSATTRPAEPAGPGSSASPGTGRPATAALSRNATSRCRCSRAAIRPQPLRPVVPSIVPHPGLP